MTGGRGGGRGAGGGVVVGGGGVNGDDGMIRMCGREFLFEFYFLFVFEFSRDASNDPGMSLKKIMS